MKQTKQDIQALYFLSIILIALSGANWQDFCFRLGLGILFYVVAATLYMNSFSIFKFKK